MSTFYYLDTRLRLFIAAFIYRACRGVCASQWPGEALAAYSTRPLGEREEGARARSEQGERPSCLLEGERN